MNKLDKFFGKYFLFALPIIGVFFVFSLICGIDLWGHEQGTLKHLNDFFGWILVIWIVVTLYLFLKMIFIRNFRDKTLKKFLKIKDTDERESLISGEAAKLSMLSTFALMTLFLFLSTMTISIGKTRGEDLFKADRNHFISIGFNPLFMGKEKQSISVAERTELFTYSGLPLPTSVILLSVLSWQLISFHLIVRKNLNQ